MHPGADPAAGVAIAADHEPHHPADLYDLWLVAEVDATLALADWSAAPPGRKRDAYVAYASALDREADAARRLELRLAGAAS